MTNAYSDSECRYLGGDPRLDERGTAEVELEPDAIRIEVKADSGSETLRIPKASIDSIYFDEQRLGFEQAEYEEGALIDPHESLIRHTVVVVANDPEGVIPTGLRIRLGFRNEYAAKVFEKRSATLYGVSTIPF